MKVPFQLLLKNCSIKRPKVVGIMEFFITGRLSIYVYLENAKRAKKL